MSLKRQTNGMDDSKELKRVKFGENTVHEVADKEEADHEEFAPLSPIEEGESAVGADEATIARARAQRKSKRAGEAIFIDEVDETIGQDLDDPDEVVDEKGIRIEPFNMRREMDQGYVDESGYFVERRRGLQLLPKGKVVADKDAPVIDAWLECVDKGEGEATFQNEKLMQAAKKRREDLDAAEAAALAASEESALPHLERLISLMKPLESVRHALKRIVEGDKSEGAPKSFIRAKKKDASQGGLLATKELTKKEKQQAADEFMALCDRLLAKGLHDVYDLTREALFQVFQEQGGGLPRDEEVEGAVLDDAAPPAAVEHEFDGGPLWIYRWKENPGEVYGPFDSTTLLSWQRSGCFSSPIEVQENDAGGNASGGIWRPIEGEGRVELELYAKIVE